MIPSAKMDALENAPPTKASNNPRTPLLALSERLLNLLGSIPGKTINEPNLYMNSKRMVKVILLRNSSMLQIFFSVVMNFFTDDNQFIICKKVKKRSLLRLTNIGKLFDYFNSSTSCFNCCFSFGTNCVNFESITSF